MDYSVFILAGEDAEDDNFNNILGELHGDVTLKHMALNAAFAAIENFTGVSVYDRYVMLLNDEKSVALTGGVVTDLTYNTQLVRGTKYVTANNFMTDVKTKTLKHILTVKGKLDASSLFFGVPALKNLLMKKDPSRIWSWANAPFPGIPLGLPGLFDIDDAEENMRLEYYHTVIAQVYSDSQSVFRELVLKNATVGSYDEYYDENGEGHFTLVINKIITIPEEGANPELTMEGPTFEANFSSVTSDISKVAKTVKKDVDKGLEVAEKLGVDKENIEKVRNVTKTGGKMLDGVDTLVSGGGLNFNPEDILDHVTEQKENVEKGMGEDVIDETTKVETKTYTDKDGNSVEEKITTNADGTKTVVKTTKDGDGNVIKTETEEYAW